MSQTIEYSSLCLWHPTPVFLPGESQGRGSLVGCRASERRGILWRWRGPSGLRWVWRNGRGPVCQLLYCATVLFKLLYCKIKFFSFLCLFFYVLFDGMALCDLSNVSCGVTCPPRARRAPSGRDSACAQRSGSRRSASANAETLIRNLVVLSAVVCSARRGSFCTH